MTLTIKLEGEGLILFPCQSLGPVTCKISELKSTVTLTFHFKDYGNIQGGPTRSSVSTNSVLEEP